MKNFTNNFKHKTNPLWIRLLIMTFMLLVGTSSAWATSLNKNEGDNRASGVEIQYNNTSKWFRIGSATGMWNNGCTPKMSGNQNNPLNSNEFGTVTTLKLIGGEVNTRLNDCGSGCNDYVEGRFSYKIYKTSESEPSSYTTGFTASNYEGANNSWCGSRWDGASDISVYKSADINLLSNLTAGDYNLKMRMETQARWSGGTFGDTWSQTASAKFTVPGYSTTSGSHSFGEVDVNSSSSDYTIELTHYGSDNDASVSITGTNKSEFTATIAENGNNQQTLTVTFKPTSVAQDKTATIKVTDAYNKTYTLNVTGTGKQSCQAPTSVSVTGSETPCVGANETYTATIDGGSKYDLEWVVPDGYTIIEGQGTTSIIVEVGTTSGNITCTATCGNAAPSDGISVAPYTTIAPTISLSTEYVCPGESATITVESPELNVEGLSYKLYNKNDTSTPIAIITEPKTEPVAFTIQEGTYYVTVSHTCGGEKKSTNEKTLQEYQAPAMPAYTPTAATSCKDVPNSDGSIVLKNAIGGISYQLDDVAGTEWINLAAGTHKLSATVDACSSLTREWDIEVGEEDITPSATVTITGDDSFCEGGGTELTSVVTATTGVVTAYQWYNGDNPIQDAVNSTYTATAAGNYKVAVTVLNSTCQDEFWSDEKVVTINPKPNEPVLSIPSPICAGSNFTLPEEDNNQRNITWNVNDRELTNLTAGTHNYTAKIIDVNGCESNEVTYTITVTALPEITSISQDVQEPVFYEDVTLTATATDGAIVKWYEGGVEKAEGTTYVVTSSSDASKIVTAKAFLNGCESEVASHPVIFSEEDCSNSDVTIESTKIEIWCRETGSSQAGSNLTCYAWYNDGSNHDLNSDNTNKGTTTSVTKTSNIEGQEYTYRVWEFDMQNYGDYDVYVIFKKSRTAWDWQTSNLEAGKRNNRYFFTYDGSQNEQSNRGEKYSESQSLSVTTHSISAPAVKTVSVNSEQGSGVVNFTGKIIKTGCADNSKIYYGYQYRLETEDWPTTGVEASNTPVNGKLIPLTNASETALHYEFSSGDINLADDNYVFRAYIINGYNFTNGNYDQGVYYGIDIPVKVSSIKEAVKDPVLQWIDEKGDPYPGGAYCPDATAYVKLTYGGSKPETVVWSNSISDSNPVSVKESLGENWYKLTVEKSGDLSVSLANEYNTTGAVQADAISLTMTSRISFPTTEVIDGKTTICSNDANGTKLRVTNAVVDYQYALYKVTDEAAGTSTKVAGPIPATNENKDNLTFTIQGSEAAGKYFVQVEETVCDQTAVSQGYTTIEVIDAGAITLTLEPNEVTVNPWLPAVLTVSITEGYDYTIDIPAPLVYTANGNVYTIKAPEPADAEYQPSSQQNQKQYGKVTFEETNYTVTADLKTDTGSSCITEQKSTITLTPYVEDCVSEYENQ